MSLQTRFVDNYTTTNTNAKSPLPSAESATAQSLFHVQIAELDNATC